MKKSIICATLLGLMLQSTPAHALNGHCEQFTPCTDAGVAYEQSVHHARIEGVVIIGVVVTAVIAVVLTNSSCKHSH